MRSHGSLLLVLRGSTKRHSGMGWAQSLRLKIPLVQWRPDPVDARWMPLSAEWKVAETIVEREYQKVIDHLEGVSVARLFELEKANQASTGKFVRFLIWMVLSTV